MPTCPNCLKEYKRSHTACKAGTCDTCMGSFKDLHAHRCHVQKVQTLNLVDTWIRIRDNEQQRISCQACGTRHFLSKNINGFRMFWNVDLCCDCYNIPQITQHVQLTRQKLLELDACTHKWKCALCAVKLFDPVTFQVERAFERDHIDVFTKSSTVWKLLVTGAPFEVLVKENNKCRNLCVRCHSAVTCAERAVGILGLKALDRSQRVSTYTKRRALQQVETLTRMLLGNVA
jgi:hypothetical protein